MDEQWRSPAGTFVDSAAARVSIGEWTTAAHFGDPAGEYEVVSGGAGLVDRGDRGLLEITGPDRSSWLGNLVTNHVTTLKAGSGNYAFAVDVKGRIQFDVNILVREECIWLDLDARWVARALEHFNKYVVMEDVRVADRGDEFIRLGVVGPAAAEASARHGVGAVADLSLLQLVEIEIAGQACFCFRDDHCGVFGIQLLISPEKVDAVWKALKDEGGLPLVGYGAVDTLRIEAGIPWPVSEINEEVLPGETRQLHRTIGSNKGCYLGQEIVERMRTRQSLARRLVLIRFEAAEAPPVGAELVADERGVGRVTSRRHSPRYGAPVALGYVRMRHSEEGVRVKAKWPEGEAAGEVLPFPGQE